MGKITLWMEGNAFLVIKIVRSTGELKLHYKWRNLISNKLTSKFYPLYFTVNKAFWRAKCFTFMELRNCEIDITFHNIFGLANVRVVFSSSFNLPSKHIITAQWLRVFIWLIFLNLSEKKPQHRNNCVKVFWVYIYIYGIYNAIQFLNTFLKDICVKVNIIAWLKFELIYFGVTIQLFSHYAMRISLLFLYSLSQRPVHSKWMSLSYWIASNMSTLRLLFVAYVSTNL